MSMSPTHHIQYEYQVPACVVAPHRAEVAIPCLQKLLAAVADHNVLLTTAAHLAGTVVGWGWEVLQEQG